MEIHGTHTFGAPRDRVWELLLDPNALRAALPACKEFRQIGEDEFEATMSIGVGAVKGTYTGKIQVRDTEPPERYRLLVEGSGRPGFLKGNGLIDLEAKEDTTIVTYRGQAQVGGMIAGVGQRLISASAQLVVGRFFEAMERQLGRNE